MESAANSRSKNLKSKLQGQANRAVGQERSYTATEAKNEFGHLLDRAVQGATVVITKHDTPRAVLISVEKFNALQQAPQMKLDALSAEFDDLLARMQSTSARGAMERAFNASPAQLGKGAVRAARKRG
jgi:prevent-host-death family protein